MTGWWVDKQETLVSNYYDGGESHDSCVPFVLKGAWCAHRTTRPFQHWWRRKGGEGACHIHVGVWGGTSQRAMLGVGASTVKKKKKKRDCTVAQHLLFKVRSDAIILIKQTLKDNVINKSARLPHSCHAVMPHMPSHTEVAPALCPAPPSRWWCYAFLCWAEAPSLNRGVTGVGFGNLVFYCLGVGEWVLLQAEDEIRLWQNPRPANLLPSPLEAYCSRGD